MAPRVATYVRLSPELHDRLVAAADERGVSVSYMVEGLVREGLGQLVPADEWLLHHTWTIKK